MRVGDYSELILYDAWSASCTILSLVPREEFRDSFSNAELVPANLRNSQ